MQESVGAVKHQAQFSSLIIIGEQRGSRFARQPSRLTGHRDCHCEAILGTGSVDYEMPAGAVPASAHGAVYGVRCASHRPRIHILLAVGACKALTTV